MDLIFSILIIFIIYIIYVLYVYNNIKKELHGIWKVSSSFAKEANINEMLLTLDEKGVLLIFNDKNEVINTDFEYSINYKCDKLISKDLKNVWQCNECNDCDIDNKNNKNGKSSKNYFDIVYDKNEQSLIVKCCDIVYGHFYKDYELTTNFNLSKKKQQVIELLSDDEDDDK